MHLFSRIHWPLATSHWPLSLCLVLAASQAHAQADPVTYDQVRPVFRKHCVTCHNVDRARGDLNLSTLEGIKAGSSSGAAAVSGKPDESSIYLSAAHLEDPKMPPNAPKIPQRELDLIRRWIEGGLAERGAVASKPAGTPSQPKVPITASPMTASAGKRSSQQTASLKIEPLDRPTPITALAVSPAAPLIAVSGRKQVVCFDQATRQPVKAFPFPEGDVFALKFSRDGARLVAAGGVGGLSGKAVAFDVATGQRVFEIGDEVDAVLALDLSPDGKLVALGGPGRSVKVFRTADGELVSTLRKHTDWILSLAYSPDGLLLASSDRFGGVQVWEAHSSKEFHTLRGHTGPVHAVSWSRESDQLLTAGEDGTLRLWNMHNGEQLSQWDGGVGPILTAELTAAGQIACGGRNRHVTLWEGTRQLRQLSLSDEVAELALSHAGTTLVAGDSAGQIGVYRVPSGELASRLELPVAPTTIASKSAAAELATTTANSKAQPLTVEKRASPLSTEAAVAEAEAKQAAADLAQAREALAGAEASVKLAEQSLGKLRETAAKLQPLVASREAAAKVAAERAADLRRRAESLTASDASDLAQRRQQLDRRLAQRRALQQSAAAVATQIQAAASTSPDDAGLRAAAKLAGELNSKLTGEIELAAGELRRLDAALVDGDSASN